jgi:hypothetical protein
MATHCSKSRICRIFYGALMIVFQGFFWFMFRVLEYCDRGSVYR